MVGAAQTASGDWRAFAGSATGGLNDLGTLGGRESRALAINAAGQIAGEAQTANGAWHAVRWDSSGPHDLGTLGGLASRALAINATGQIAGEAQKADGAWHAFLWTASPGLSDLGTLGGQQSRAEDLNDTGDVAGEAQTINAIPHAVLWPRTGGLRDLGTLGGPASRAYRVTADGQILGEAQDAEGLWQRVVWAGRDPADPERRWIPLPRTAATPQAAPPASRPVSASTAFVAYLYTQFYGHDGDTDDVTFWRDQIDSCADSPANVVKAFFEAPEFMGVTAPVVRLYSGIFNRIPDGPGLADGVRQSRAGVSLDTMAAHFIDSREFRNRYGTGLSDAAFVDLLGARKATRWP